LACRVLGVAESGYYDWRSRSVSARELRHAWLTDAIRKVYADSFGVYGAHRVHAELTLGMGIAVGHNAACDAHASRRDSRSTRREAAQAVHETPTALDLVDRKFAREEPNQLWVTDITEHPTREG
jgi:putative transposase